MKLPRLFARLATNEDAARLIKEATTGFVVIALIQGIASLIVAPRGLWDAACFLALAVTLRALHSRLAAAALLALTALSLSVTLAAFVGAHQAGGNLLIAGGFFFVALRTVEATCFLAEDELPVKVMAMATAILVGFAGFLAIYSYSQRTMWSSMLEATVQQLNKQTPVDLDEVTRMDAVSHGPGRILTYEYTLLPNEPEKLATEAFRKALRDSLVTAARKGMAPYAAQKITLIYLYRDPLGDEMFRVKLAPEDYSGGAPGGAASP